MVSVLIAEDEATARNSIRDCVAALGIERIYLAENGRQALTIYEKQKPDIVITDIQMPVMNGIELVNHIHEHNPNAAVIFLTAHSDTDYMKKAIRAGAVDYIFKPVSAGELEYAIARSRERMNSFARKNLNILREQFFRDLISGSGAYSGIAYDRMCRELELPPEPGSYAVIAVRLPASNERGFDRSRPFALQSQPLCSVIYAALKACDFHYSFIYDSREVISVCGCLAAVSEINMTAEAEKWKRLGRRISTDIENHCLRKIQVRVSAPAVQLGQLEGCGSRLVEINGSAVNPAGRVAVTEKDNHITERIHNIIEESYSNPELKVSDIAEELFYTSAYLCMVFKKVSGITINDYIHICRLKKAKSLMKDNSLRIVDVAVRAGYSNENYFSKVFKKYEGVTPGAYRDSITVPEGKRSPLQEEG